MDTEGKDMPEFSRQRGIVGLKKRWAELLEAAEAAENEGDDVVVVGKKGTGSVSESRKKVIWGRVVGPGGDETMIDSEDDESMIAHSGDGGRRLGLAGDDTMDVDEESVVLEPAKSARKVKAVQKPIIEQNGQTSSDGADIDTGDDTEIVAQKEDINNAANVSSARGLQALAGMRR